MSTPASVTGTSANDYNEVQPTSSRIPNYLELTYLDSLEIRGHYLEIENEDEDMKRGDGYKLLRWHGCRGRA